MDVPYYLKVALKRLMKEYVRDIDLNRFEQEFKNIPQISNDEFKKKGQFVFIHYNGYAPKKVPVRFKIDPTKYGRGDLTQVITMEYPTFQLRSHRIAYAQININNQIYRTEIVEPIERIAVIDLMDRIGSIFTKMILRRITKYLASKFAGAAANDKTVELLGNLASNLSERADLRSWRVLPAEISKAPILLPPGKYNATITFHAFNGFVIDRIYFNDIIIKPGQKVYKIYRTDR